MEVVLARPKQGYEVLTPANEDTTSDDSVKFMFSVLQLVTYTSAFSTSG